MFIAFLVPRVHSYIFRQNTSIVSRVYTALATDKYDYKGMYLQDCSHIPGLTKKQEMVLNVSKLLPFAKEYATSFLSDMNGLNILWNCSSGNEAVVAIDKELLSLKHFYNVHRSQFKMPLSFGEEFIEVNQLGLRFKGWVPPVIIFRMKAMYTMGMVTYFDSKRRKSYSEKGSLNDFPERLVRKVTPPRMGDSISVVFLVLPLGMLMGFWWIFGNWD